MTVETGLPGVLNAAGIWALCHCRTGSEVVLSFTRHQRMCMKRFYDVSHQLEKNMKNLENIFLYSSCQKISTQWRTRTQQECINFYSCFSWFPICFPSVFPGLREARRFFRRHVLHPLHPIRGLAVPGSWGACITSTGSSDLGPVVAMASWYTQHGTVGYRMLQKLQVPWDRILRYSEYVY